MAKRKGLSADEKRSKLLEIFQETCEVFQLKDLERIAPIEKGIVVQSVKNTLQELVDSGEVRSEKISGSTYYWSFPSEALRKSNLQLEAIEAQNLQLEQTVEKMYKQLETAEANSANAVHAEVLALEVKSLMKEKEQLEKKLSTLTANINYEEIEIKERDAMKILEAANRWTDNIYSIKSWCKSKFGKEEAELNKGFGIPEDLDYLET